MVSWGSPIAGPRRCWEALAHPIGQLLAPDMRRSLDSLEPGAASGSLDLNRASLLVENILELRRSTPPASWSPPARRSVGWDGLTRTEREVLTAALSAAKVWLPDVQLWLFGSRAEGRASVDSDYDLALVVPDDTDAGLRAVAMGEVYKTVGRMGTRAGHRWFTTSQFREPPDDSREVAGEIKLIGIEVTEL